MATPQRLETFFPKKIVGLELLQNPQKSKKTGFSYQVVSEPKDSLVHTEIDTFRNMIMCKLSDFQLPLRPFDRSDPIMVLLEAGYYQYFGQQYHPSGYNTNHLSNDVGITNNTSSKTEISPEYSEPNTGNIAQPITSESDDSIGTNLPV